MENLSGFLCFRGMKKRLIVPVKKSLSGLFLCPKGGIEIESKSSQPCKQMADTTLIARFRERRDAA